MPRDRVQPAAHLTRDRSRVSACRIEGVLATIIPFHVAQRVPSSRSTGVGCRGGPSAVGVDFRPRRVHDLLLHTRRKRAKRNGFLDLRMIRATKLSRVYEYPLGISLLLMNVLRGISVTLLMRLN